MTAFSKAQLEQMDERLLLAFPDIASDLGLPLPGQGSASAPQGGCASGGCCSAMQPLSGPMLKAALHKAYQTVAARFALDVMDLRRALVADSPEHAENLLMADREQMNALLGLEQSRDELVDDVRETLARMAKLPGAIWVQENRIR